MKLVIKKCHINVDDSFLQYVEFRLNVGDSWLASFLLFPKLAKILCKVPSYERS